MKSALLIIGLWIASFALFVWQLNEGNRQALWLMNFLTGG